MRRRLARPCGDLAAALERYGAQRPHPVSIQRWTRDFAEPRRLAQFLCSEMPIRYAERLRCIEGVKGWRELRELRELHRIQLMAFQAFANRWGLGLRGARHGGEASLGGRRGLQRPRAAGAERGPGHQAAAHAGGPTAQPPGA